MIFTSLETEIMFTAFINIPIRLGDIMQKSDVARVSMKDSIHNMIHLIATTAYGEVRNDPSFGCEIWKFDFENIYNPPTFREELKKSLQASIKANETRLTRVSIDLQIDQLEVPTKIRSRRVKTRILLVVSGVIEKTNEPFTHQELFFMGPLSYY